MKLEEIVARERAAFKQEFLDDIIDAYSETYNLFNGMTKSQIVEFLRGKKNIEMLTQRRKSLLSKMKKIIDNLSGRDTILPVDDLPIGELGSQKVKEIVRY